MKPFVLIQYVLICVGLITFINGYLHLKFKKEGVFNLLIGLVNVYLGFNAIYAFLIEQFFLDKSYLDRMAPFALMYGPFLYFATISLRDHKISTRQFIIHSMPAFIFWVLFITLLFLDVERYNAVYLSALGITGALSFSTYTLWAIVNNARALSHQLKQLRMLILAAILLLLFMSMVQIIGLMSKANFYGNETATGLLRMMVYGCMLGAVLLIFRYEIHFIFKIIKTKEVVPVQDDVEPEPSEARYEKSTLTIEQLEGYAHKLEALMNEDQVYLQHDLSLVKLAQLMRVPSHHVTQVLSLKIKANFYDYINGFRVNHACLLLQEEGGVILEVIAARSGFNSKVSFNRHFKSVKGCTPSGYRVSLK